MSTLNSQSLERLRAVGGKRLIQGVIDLFLTHVPVRIETARAGLAAGDLKVVERAVHSIRSSAGNVGAEVLGDVAGKIEQLAAKNETAEIASLLRDLQQAYNNVKERLEKEAKVLAARRQIALVEDNPDNRLLVRVMLGDSYKVSEYETGPDALEGFKKEAPDLVILDISLPEMDGTEVLQKIRGEPKLRHLPVIALSAHGVPGDREHYLKAGFDEYLSKPLVDETLLLSAVKRLLDEI